MLEVVCLRLVETRVWSLVVLSTLSDLATAMEDDGRIDEQSEIEQEDDDDKHYSEACAHSRSND